MSPLRVAVLFARQRGQQVPGCGPPGTPSWRKVSLLLDARVFVACQKRLCSRGCGFWGSNLRICRCCWILASSSPLKNVNSPIRWRWFFFTPSGLLWLSNWTSFLPYGRHEASSPPRLTCGPNSFRASDPDTPATSPQTPIFYVLQDGCRPVGCSHGFPRPVPEVLQHYSGYALAPTSH